MSKSHGGLWNRLKSIINDSSHDSFTVIPGNSRVNTHFRYEDGSVSVVPLPPNMRDMAVMR